MRTKINSFYSEGTKDVRNELFDKLAEAIAGDFICRDGKVTKTQLRRLYNEVKRFELMLDGSPEKWKKNYPYIRKIKAVANYSILRAKQQMSYSENKDVYDDLSAFLTEGIDLIKDEQDYRVFTALFEAVYGFYCVKNPKND